MRNFEVFPLKGLFNNNEDYIFKIMYDSNEFKKNAVIKVFHLNEIVFVDECILEFIGGTSIYHVCKLTPNRGYGLTVEIDDEMVITAFESYDAWTTVPRYAFLSDFAPDDINNERYLDTLLKLHINVVQYYDWMYQHNDLIAKEEPFIDLMGRQLSQKVVKEKVKTCKLAGIKNIAYGAIYGASNEFYEDHKEWAFYNDNEEPIRFIDVFTIMNFTNESSWRNHLINEYKKAIREIGFDGIHMDTYGYPKVAKDYQGNVIRLDEHFSSLINEVKKELETDNLASDLIFNNVGAWPINKTYHAKQSALYIEIWDPFTTYNNLMDLIKYVKTLTTNKQLIIAAYLKPYFKANCVGALSAHKLLSAVIYATGASHLIMGEAQKVLRTGYYCDYGELNDSDFNEIRKYYDFNAMYGEILYDSELIDVSFTHAKGDNIEYKFLNVKWSPTATGGNVLTIIKEKDKQKVIHLINMTSSISIEWNIEQPDQNVIKNIEVVFITLSDIENIYICSPDLQVISKSVEFQSEKVNNGNKITIKIDKLRYWSMIIINEK